MANKKGNPTKRKAVSAGEQAQYREWRQMFHAVGLRLTKQRFAIYRELETNVNHPDVDTIFRAVRTDIPKISLFTVYRTMNMLEEAGLAWRITTWKSHARYGTSKERQIAHFLCEKCGRIDNVELEGLATLRRSAEKTLGTLTGMDLIFRGTGTCCAARAKAAARARN
ncbi:MAG: transcriptional repressor [Spartobacteria bacterium]|nr:transcriptional repressor [Spartobacteria bacterium]